MKQHAIYLETVSLEIKNDSSSLDRAISTLRNVSRPTAKTNHSQWESQSQWTKLEAGKFILFMLKQLDVLIKPSPYTFYNKGYNIMQFQLTSKSACLSAFFWVLLIILNTFLEPSMIAFSILMWCLSIAILNDKGSLICAVTLCFDFWLPPDDNKDTASKIWHFRQSKRSVLEHLRHFSSWYEV